MVLTDPTPCCEGMGYAMTFGREMQLLAVYSRQELLSYYFPATPLLLLCDKRGHSFSPW
jgi:hypothetical protein